MNAWLVFLVLAYVISFSLTSGPIVFPCETPDGEHAYCVSLFSCPHLMKSLSTLDPKAIDYAKRSICLGCEAGDVMVCCGSPKNSSVLTDIFYIRSICRSICRSEEETITSEPPQVINARREYVRTNLLPSQRICGQQHTDDRVNGDGNETALDEFPWIVEIESANNYADSYGLKCNGVLINNRYVLTAHSCGEFAHIVKLGQYSNQKDVNCVQSSPLYLECTEPVVTKNVEDRIFHKVPNYNYFYNKYDLMLLRLNESVKYSDYIRPICLPIDGSKRPTSENYLTFSGFGADDTTEVLKKKITYNLTSSQVCYDADENLKEDLETSPGTLACLVPPPGNTLAPCWAERGAPLMYKYKHKWFVDAIIINVAGGGGFRKCNSSVPISGVYVTPIMMDWILDDIKD